MSYRSDRVKEWRRHTKERIVQGMGGKCQICNYNKCYDALELHHIDPTKKSFSFGSVIANPKKWDVIMKELKKCVLLCANHHREFHAGIIQLPTQFQTFDEELIKISKIKDKLYDSCPICGDKKLAQQITCSRNCAAKKTWRVDWTTINLPNLLLTKNMSQIGDMIGVSNTAVKKRMKKLRLI